MSVGRFYQWGGGTCRPYLKKVSTRRMKHLSVKRETRIKGTVMALGAIIERGFVFTNNLKVFAEVIGYLKSNQIPYQYIDGGKHWEYAIRRTDREVSHEGLRTEKRRSSKTL